MSKRKTTEEFIQQARSVHGDKYKYSKTVYVNSRHSIIIVCPFHGEFNQVPNDHLRGNGCPLCGVEKRIKSKTLNRLVEKLHKLVQPEDYKLIPLTKGKFAIVDNEDFDKLKDINWYATKYNYAKNSNIGLMHRFIMNAPDHLEVDHINHNTLDNRRENLRLATRPQNSANTRAQRGSSIYKGVSWNKYINKWVGQIYVDGEHHRIGYFTDEIECAKAYDKKALELQGEFAYLNFPELKEQYLKEIKKKNHE